MDNKGARSRLFKVMDNLDEIEAWRDTLPINKKRKLNHPELGSQGVGENNQDKRGVHQAYSYRGNPRVTNGTS